MSRSRGLLCSKQYELGRGDEKTKDWQKGGMEGPRKVRLKERSGFDSEGPRIRKPPKAVQFDSN